MQIEISNERLEKLKSLIWGNDPVNNCHTTGCSGCTKCNDWDDLEKWISEIKSE